MAYIGNSPANVGNYQVVDDISSTFNGVLKSFALTASSLAINPAKSGQLLVSINGVLQEPDDTGTEGFKVSGSNIVFSSAPATGSTFWAVWQGQAVDIGTPSDGVVGTAQMSSAELALTGGLSLGDNVKAKFGTGDDLEIYHSGTNSYLWDKGTGNLFILGTSVTIGDAAGYDFLQCVDEGSGGYVRLNHTGNAEKLRTTSTGVDVTGSVTCDGFTSTGIDDNATSTAITIDASENVGIGTSSPSQKLDVNGTIIASSTSSQGARIERNGTTGGANFDSVLASGSLHFRTGTTERMRVTANGLTFNGDTAAANALDDYEEGTWSPVWTPDSGTIVTNTTYTGGVYTKVGNLVTVHCRLYTNSVSSPTGKITISGLPYAIKNSPYTTPYVLWPLLGLNGSLAGMPIANTLPNTTTLQLSDWSWGTTESGSNIADKFDADVWCHAGLTYMTN